MNQREEKSISDIIKSLKTRIDRQIIDVTDKMTDEEKESAGIWNPILKDWIKSLDDIEKRRNSENEKLDKLIEGAKFAFANILDGELYQPMKEELKRYGISHSLGFKKEMFKNKIEMLFDDLKNNLKSFKN